jgi:membrane-associated phospholipid phosphatase
MKCCYTTCALLGCFAALLFCNTAYAAETPASYPDLLLDDITHVITAPSRWQSEEWKNFGWASLAVASTAAVIDAPLRDEMRRQPGDSTFLLYIERFGAEYSIGVVGGFYLAGSMSDDDKAKTVAQDALTASIIASGMITPAIKIVSGRSRPYENTGTNDFQGLGASKRNSSFPSGHTTEAFALASVISAHYDETWVTASAYSIAGLVGIARTYHDAHFASDVLAGAFIGNWVGTSVVNYNQQNHAKNIVFFPETTQDIIGVHIYGQY